MIKINLLRKSAQLLGFEITGHSDYAQSGQDIVCAAVSILSFTAVNTLNFYHKKFDFCDDKDRFYLELKSNDITTDVILNNFRIGIESLTENYKEYVRLHLKEV